MKYTHKLLVLSFLVNFAKMLVGASSVIYLFQKGISESEIALLKLFQFIVIILSDLPLSYLADKFGKRLSLILSASCFGLWLFITAIAGNRVLIYLGEFFNALAMTFFGGAFIALLINTHKMESDDGIIGVVARNTKFSSLGMILGAGIGALFSQAQLTLLWLLATCVFALVLMYIFWALSGLPSRSSSDRLRVKDLLRSIRHHVHNILCVYFFYLNAMALSFFTIAVQYNQIVIRNAFSQSTSLFYYSLFFLVILAVQFIASHLVALTRIPTNIWNLVVVLLVISLLISGNVVLDLSLWILMYFVVTIIKIQLSSRFHELVEDKFRASMDSVLSTCANLTASISIYLVYRFYTDISTVYIYALVVFALQSVVMGAWWARFRGE